MYIQELDTKAPETLDKKDIEKATKELKSEMAELQHKMRAQEKYSLLIILQGMDASGKDGVVRRVFSEIPAFGINVASFKQPTREELAHDFLWRVHQQTPKKGQITIFNRSHYEDVLVTRVLGLTDDETAKKRFKLINDFENIVQHNNTIILKFFLNASKEEQKEDLLDRMKNPEKFFKHSDGDWETRAQWDLYMQYYNECIKNTQEYAKWHIVPSDQNWYKDYTIAKTVVETLQKLPLAYPPLKTELDINKLK